RTRTMQWDIAAGDALLRAAGGGLLDDEGRLLTYGRTSEGWVAPCFMAYGALPAP
ncbi:MAG: 3'(2'),5'-bisphosphate nucleotidase CysQ, partial [Hyphomicrobiales bacterium]|nr:3'(2'),5'-bisphosphate nucleotidase CysQ [Hyphomicrobiales bacterium]